MYQPRPYVAGDQIHRFLKAIKENDGFPGPLPSNVRLIILLDQFATVEVSPLTGMDFQWTLTKEGKRKLSEFNRNARYNAKYKERKRLGYGRPSRRTEDVVVPLTIEVLDALKSIRETGEPNTDKMEILSRIQLYGIHAAKYVKGANGENHLVHGALANCTNGVWTLTDAGKRVEAGHIPQEPVRSVYREGKIMRLVVSYSEGDGCTYSCQCDVPVEYESAEQLLVDIEDAANRYLAVDAAYYAAWQEFDGKRGSFSDIGSLKPKQREEWQTAYLKFCDEHKRPDPDDFRIKQLRVNHFIEGRNFYAPAIYTVDEWFEAAECGDL
jgi:hypothetical protein